MKKKLMLIISLIAALVLVTAMATTVASAATTKGAIGYRYYNNGQYYFKAMTSTTWEMSMTSELNGTYYLGTSSSSNFTRSSDITSVEIVIKKNGQEVGRQKAEVGQAVTSGSKINGISYSVGCKTNQDSGLVEELTGTIGFVGTDDAYLYYKDLIGTYVVSAEWVSNGVTYTGTTNFKLTSGKVFSNIYVNNYNNSGAISDFWGNTTWLGTSNNTAYFEYNELEAYYGTQYDEKQDDYVEKEVVRTCVYTDSSVNGIFDYTGCSSSELASVFTTGDKIKFAAGGAEVTPLYIHPNNITESMIGKSCTLTFTNGNLTRTITMKITKDSNDYLTEGKLYAIYDLNYNDFSYSLVRGDSDEVKICFGDSSLMTEWSYDNRLSESIEIEVDDYQNYEFVIYQNGKLKPVELTNPDETILNLNLVKSDDGIYRYRAEGLKRGAVYLISKSNSNLKIECKVMLPDRAFFSKNERSAETYLEELHYIDAVEKGDSEVYFYLMTIKWGAWSNLKQSDFTVKFCDNYEDEDGNWKEKYYDEPGVTFEAVGEYYDSWEDATFFVWKMTMTEDFDSSEDWRDYKWGRVCAYAGELESDGYYEYSSWVGSTEMHDATEIPANEQLYWFNQWSVEVGDDGKLSMDADTSGTLDNRAEDYIRQWDASGSEEGYLACKQGDDYYIIDSDVTCTPSDKLFITKLDDGKYSIRWRGTGKYTLSTSYNGQNYRIKMKASLDVTNFYSKNEVDEKWILEDDDFYFNDAIEKSEDGKAAYFYYITDYSEVNSQSQLKTVETEYDEELEKSITTIVEYNGIEIGDLQTLTVGDETYYSWKITITDEFVGNSYGKWIRFGVFNGDEIEHQVGIDVYDSTKKAATYGDIDDNGEKNIIDVLCLKRYVAGWYGYDNDVTKRIADLNRDGVIDAGDVMILERHIAGWKDFKTLPKTA